MCFGRLWCSDLITLVRRVPKLCSFHMEKTRPGNPPWWGTPPYMWMRSRKRERLSSPRLKTSRLRSPTYVWTGPNRFRPCHKLVQETAMFNMSLMGSNSQFCNKCTIFIVISACFLGHSWLSQTNFTHQNSCYTRTSTPKEETFIWSGTEKISW